MDKEQIISYIEQRIEQLRHTIVHGATSEVERAG